MFSGIIEELGQVKELAPKKDGGGLLTITAPRLSPEIEPGDSVCVNGVCLTAVNISKDSVSFDLSQETLRVTNLGRLAAGDPVNLELALKIGDRLGGHFVSGHVDEVGTIRSRTEEGDCFVFTISAGSKILKLLIDRGSVAVDGISLTVTKILPDAFELVIIPHTAELTTLGQKKAGDEVNLEADMIGKHIAGLMEREAN